MTDARRIASIACFMLVTLRLMIGWQLLYEGLWKIKTLKSPTPWTASGYLKNSKGPMRDYFRDLAGDADDLGWIEAKAIDPEAKDKRYWVPGVEPRWDRWQKAFTSHYSLTDNQAKRLNTWVNGAKTYEVELAELPASIDFEELRLKNVISYNTEKKRLVVNGTRHLMPDHRNKVEKRIDADLDGIPDSIDASVDEDASDYDKDGIVDAADVDATEGTDDNKNGIDDSSDGDKEAVFLVALKAVFKKSKDGLSYKEKLRATVAGNPEWVDSDAAQKVGEVTKYKVMLANYEADLKKAKAATSIFPFADKSFRFDHLDHAWGKIQSKRAELVGPVKALESEMKGKAQELLSVEQLKRGPVPEPWTTLRISDMMTIAGLTILGAMLILGIWTRFAAVMAAVMLFMFYAAMPPWPGVPAIPGPEHSFIVNKNFIEVIALLAVATLPTGRWFGVDGMIGRYFSQRRLAREEKFASKWDN